MKLKITSIDKALLDEFRKIIRESTEGGNLLSISEFRLNKHHTYQFIIALVVFTIFIFSVDRQEVYWIYGAIILFSFFLTKFLYLILIQKKVSKSFLYFDENIVLKKELDSVEFFPLHRLTAVDFERAESDNFVLLKLSFGNDKLYYPYENSLRNVLERFARNIVNIANAKKRGISGQITSSKLLLDFIYKSPSTIDTKYKTKFWSVSVIISCLILYFLAPYFLDWNSFRKAHQINTATSFREYLKEDKNYLYRENAKDRIIEKYDDAIDRYKNINTIDNNAMIIILEYLKNNEIYIVDIIFKNNNKIKDISEKYDVKIKSAEYSFTTIKNKEREHELVTTLNQTLGRIFPSDIISIENITDRENVPKIEITYTYLNSEEGSLYYPVDQENLNENNRDYYFGLTINWDFSLYIPIEKFPISSFTLKSNPAIQFSAETSSTDNVYSNMVYSAFKDFNREFKKHYFENE